MLLQTISLWSIAIKSTLYSPTDGTFSKLNSYPMRVFIDNTGTVAIFLSAYCNIQP